jgi:hypothetical protein
MSQARMLLRTAILALLIVGSAEIWVECMCDDVIAIEVGLLLASDARHSRNFIPF